MEELVKQLKNLDLSKLHFYSYGIVVEDNLDNNKTIKIFPIEKLFIEGDDLIKDEEAKPSSLKCKYKTVKLVPDDIEPRYEIKEEILPLIKTKYLYAKWSGISNSNRVTPPNVCKGEHVIIYRYSNSDTWFWDTINTNRALRKEEDVVYSFSDKPDIDPNGREEPLEDTYYIQFSTKNKQIKIHTTDKYDELTTYDITIKTDEGYIEIIDGKGNLVKLDSSIDTLTVKTNATVNIISPVTNILSGIVNIKSGRCNINP